MAQALDLTAEAVRAMVQAERAALARQEEFALARQASPTQSSSLWSEHTLRHIQEFGDERPVVGDEEEIVHEMLQLPAEAARARLGRELSAVTQLPIAAADDDDDDAELANHGSGAARDDGAWTALLQRVATLESSNDQLQKTVSQLAEMVNELRGGGGYGSYAPESSPPQRVGAAARHLAASRAAAPTAAAPEGTAGLLPSEGIDLRAAVARKHLHSPAYGAGDDVGNDAPTAPPVVARAPKPAPTLTPTPSGNGNSYPTPSPAFSAARQMVATTQERAHASSMLGAGGRDLASPDERSLAASLSAVRSAAEDRVARSERMERAAAAERMGGNADVTPVSSIVTAWWSAHFGAGADNEVVPFERMRAAAESELGPLSSVDIQLLRLELSDERGKLTKTALKRLLGSSADGASSHMTVGAALQGLLKAARAQLDRQVEVRMKQAASKSKRTPSGAPTPSSAGRRMMHGVSPTERRVRLEFDN